MPLITTFVAATLVGVGPASDPPGAGMDYAAATVRIATELCPRTLLDRALLNDRALVAGYGLFVPPPDFEAGLRRSDPGAETAMGQFEGGEVVLVSGTRCSVLLDGEKLVEAFDAAIGKLRREGAKVVRERFAKGMRWMEMTSERYRVQASVNPSANAGAIVFTPRR